MFFLLLKKFKCPNHRVAYGILKSLKRECRNMGGAWNLNPGEYDLINCHLDSCEAQTGKIFFAFRCRKKDERNKQETKEWNLYYMKRCRESKGIEWDEEKDVDREKEWNYDQVT